MSEDDPAPAGPPPSGALLFCPFCREAFEGERACPDHELVLVPYEALPEARRRDAPAEDEPLSAYDPRLGRAFLFVSVVVILIGFMLPFATTTAEDRTLTLSGFEIASRRPVLWAVPAVAGAMILVLAFRRT